MNKIRATKMAVSELSSFSVDLLREGYTESEIDLAFTWLFEKAGNNDGIEALTVPMQAAAYRQLHSSEKMVIQTAAYGYLLQLRTLDLIDDVEMEQVIEHAMLSGEPSVDREDMEELVAMIMFDINSLYEDYTFNNGQIVH